MKLSTLLRIGIAIPALLLLGLPARASEWKPIKSVFFVGDSITRSAPSERLSWKGNWGMAATSQETAYTHRLVAMITEKQGFAPSIEIFAKGGGTLAGLLENVATLSAARADLIIVQMGENDRDPTVTGFEEPYAGVIRVLRQGNPFARIVCTGVWGPPNGSPVKDAFIRSICHDQRLPFADISEIQRNPLARASNVTPGMHAGVGWHPSDLGMEGYAKAIFSALERGEAAIPPASRSTVSSPGRVAAGLVFVETFDRSDSLESWAPRTNGEIVAGAVRIASANPSQSVTLVRSLPVGQLAGNTVKISARVKGRGLSQPPKSYLGLKLMLEVTDAEAIKDYPQARPGEIETFDWREISFVHRVPENTVNLRLVIGLSQISGEAWFDDVKIEILP